MSQENLVHFINEFYSRINKAAQNTGGIVDKLLGDGALILWGVEKDTPNKESQAIQFFLRLRTEVNNLNKENRRLGLPSFKIGTGLNSGEVTLGLFGDDVKMEHTAIGSPVNLASHLEKLCKTHQKDCIASMDFLNKLNKKERSLFNLFTIDHLKGVGDHVTLGALLT